jgi:predicted nucleic acid-binding protein
VIASRSDRPTFVDTSAWFAFANRRDEHHEAVDRLFNQLAHAGHRYVTTNFVLAELHALIIRRGPADIATPTIIQIMESPLTAVVRVRANDEGRALQILQRYTDATSFAVMERLGMRRAFSLAHHFAQYGWEMIQLDTR